MKTIPELKRMSVIIIIVYCFSNLFFSSFFILLKLDNFLVIVPPLFYFGFNIFWRIYRYNTGSKNDDNYIFDQYPEIWNKMHPMGRYSTNSFAFLRFINSEFDNDSDFRLSLIREKFKLDILVTFSLFFIVIPFSLISLILNEIINKF